MSNIRMPQAGEGWRHYKGGHDSLYQIIGLARDEDGNAVVIYAPYMWSLAQPMPLYTRKLGDFLKEIPIKQDQFTGKHVMAQRFTFERSVAEAL